MKTFTSEATSCEELKIPEGVEWVYLKSLPEPEKEKLRKERPEVYIY